MRSIFALAAVAVAAMISTAAPAAAKWTCEGPEYVCGSASSAAAPSTASKSATKKAKATSQQASYDKPAKAKKKSYYSEASSSGANYSGKASYYWQPQKVASGGWFNPNAMTAAHKTLPFGTKVRVTNHNNGQSVVVTINDRGPYVAGRIIDLSKAAAHAINMQGSGVVPVTVAVLGKG
jgi:rare lipoprotein A